MSSSGHSRAALRAGQVLPQQDPTQSRRDLASDLGDTLSGLLELAGQADLLVLVDQRSRAHLTQVDGQDRRGGLGRVRLLLDRAVPLGVQYRVDHRMWSARSSLGRARRSPRRPGMSSCAPRSSPHPQAVPGLESIRVSVRRGLVHVPLRTHGHHSRPPARSYERSGPTRRLVRTRCVGSGTKNTADAVGFQLFLERSFNN